MLFGSALLRNSSDTICVLICLCVTASCSGVQPRPFCCFCVYVSTLCEQQLHDAAKATLRGKMQRCLARIVGRLHGGMFAQEIFNHRLMAILGGGMQRRLATIALCVHFRSIVQKELH